ncbi:MAG: gliding motility-associated C-terminal domain-containing protein [Bacteroidaceae bacterium]|nr:gliding motility-associated C-terminal domain-containing protein [Bacteroidaceae bacterium]
MNRFIAFFVCLCPLFVVWAQSLPTVDPQGKYITVEGDEIDDASASQSAPLVAHFSANASNVGDYSERYEWKIWKEGDADNLLVHRSGGSEMSEIDYTFTESGSFRIQLYATFVLGNDTINYPKQDEDAEAVYEPLLVSISTSKLDFPNAISPNGDDYNDKLRAKDGYQSIVSFEAAVFNRWGTKIFSWNNIEDGWDGTWHGRTVKDGAYLLVVNARGADGRKYNIRKTITVISGHNSKRGETSGDEH